MIKRQTNNAKKDLYRALIPFILLFIIIIGVFCFKSCKAAEPAMQEYESIIEENNTQIQYYENIQNQLHTTAELLRQERNPDNRLIEKLSKKWHYCESNINEFTEKNKILQSELNALLEKQKIPVFIGYFEISHYDICYNCTGKKPSDRGYGITATGTKATPNRTIAVDPTVIPYGTEVIIDGQTYIAEDTGGAIKGNRIDICVSSDAEAYKKGRRFNVPAYIVRK